MSEDAEISNEQLAWCDRLWSSLRVGGKWQLPNVGIYIKTSDESLTLTELYFSRPTPDAFGNTAFDTHDWVIQAATILNWKVDTNIERSFDWSGEAVEEWPDDRIGDVAVCEANCGAIIRAEPFEPGKYYFKMENQSCPCCGKKGFSKDWVGHWVVIDDTATKLKRNRASRNEEE